VAQIEKWNRDWPAARILSVLAFFKKKAYLCGAGRNSLQLTTEVVFCLHQGGLVELNNSADSLYGY